MREMTARPLRTEVRLNVAVPVAVRLLLIAIDWLQRGWMKEESVP